MVNEPHMFVEQSAWNSSTTSDILVTISSHQFETLAKSFFYVSIKQANVHVLNRSANTSIAFTDSLDDLKTYFLDQVNLKSLSFVDFKINLFNSFYFSALFIRLIWSAR